MATHGLVRTLKKLDGNVNGVVLTEPLWGVPFNLYAPYVSVYMLALGAGDVQIGTIVTMSTVAQVFWTLMAGAITGGGGLVGALSVTTRSAGPRAGGS